MPPFEAPRLALCLANEHQQAANRQKEDEVKRKGWGGEVNGKKVNGSGRVRGGRFVSTPCCFCPDGLDVFGLLSVLQPPSLTSCFLTHREGGGEERGGNQRC